VLVCRSRKTVCPYWDTEGSNPPSRAALARLGRYLGALALLGVGIDHIEQYYVDSYSVIPTIGTLFALNFISAALVTLGLLAPIGRIFGRWAIAALALLAGSGILIAAGLLAGLLISENGGLFGFMERGYREAIALEVATMILLGLFHRQTDSELDCKPPHPHGLVPARERAALTPDRLHAD
jgi:hypothetical protein